MQDGPILVLCTAPNADVGATLGRGLVEAKLAACVNIIPGIRSIYRWEGAVQDEEEVQLLIKTRRALFETLRDWLNEKHPYDVPELLAFPIEAGSKPYLDWVHEQTS